MSSIPVFDISNPLSGLMDQAVAMGYVNEKRTTTKGAVASFEDNIEHPVSIKADIDPTLDGVSAVNVTVAGKNLFDETTLTVDNTLVTSTGGTQSNTAYKSTDYIFMKAGKYTMSGIGCDDNESTIIRFRLASYDMTPSKTFIALDVNSYGAIADGTSYNVTFTLASDCYVRISYRKDEIENLMIEKGEESTVYESYIGNKITITLGQTIHGGSVTVDENGDCESSADFDIVVFDSNSSASDFEISVVENQPNRIAWSPYQTIGKVGSLNFLSDVLAISESYTSRPPAWTVSGSAANAARCFIGVPDTIDTVQKWLDYVAETPITLGYEIAIPTTSDLDPIDPINTLEGLNNIYADTGDIEVGYYYQLYQPI